MTEEPPRSGPQYLARFVHREVVVLAILCLAAAGVFALTQAAAAASRDLRARDARVWYQRGVADLRRGHPAEAVEALSRARALDRDAGDYQLALSRALIAAGQRDSGRQTLLSLRQTMPEDPEVNIALAELEAGAGRPDSALRYFQSALHGDWRPDDLDARLALRRRLIEYLLDQQMASRALAQLLILQDDVASDPRSRADIAAMFLRAGDPSRALTGFRLALAGEPRNVAALTGAARAAFALGDYASASRYLARLPSGESAVEELRTLTAAVLAADPFGRGIRAREQRRRLDAGRTVVTKTLEACRARLGSGTPSALTAHADELARLPRASGAARRIEADEEAAIIGRAAAAVPQACGPFTGPFRAWVLLGRSRREEAG